MVRWRDMHDWIARLREEDRVSLLPLLAIGLLIIVTPLFLGGNGYVGESFLFLLTGPIAYFTWRSDPKAFAQATLRPVSIVFILLVGAMALSLIPSADRFSTLTGVLNWVAFYFIFISTSVVVTSERRMQFLASTAIVSATLLSLVGLYGLLYTDNFGYLRLTSTFDQHNAFGGFLLLPLALLIGYFLSAKTRRSSWVAGISLIFVGGAFVLSFSRGSWVSFLFGLGVALIVFRKNVWALVQNKKILAGVLIVVLGISGIAFGMLHVTKLLAATQNQGVGVFTGETVGQNALTARLEYFKDALRVIRENSLYGVGLRHYGEAVKLYKNTPAFYASSPHNEYLKLFAEIGILGGCIFIALILLLLLKIGRATYSYAKTDEWLPYAGLLAGGLAVATHLGMEVDWGYMANPLLFITFAGALYGVMQKDMREEMNRFVVRSINTILLLGAMAVSVVGIGYWHQMYHTEQGVVYLHQNRLSDAFLELKEAFRFAYINSSPHYFASLTLEQAAHLSTDGAKQKSFLRQSLIEIDRAIAQKSEKPLYYSWQALIYKELGDVAGYTKALQMTIQYNPVEGIYEYGQLMTLYVSGKEYDKAITLAEKVLPYYPLEMYANPYWANPEKGTVWRQVADIYTQLSIAYANKGDINRAKEMQAKSLQYYNPASAK